MDTTFRRSVNDSKVQEMKIKSRFFASVFQAKFASSIFRWKILFASLVEKCFHITMKNQRYQYVVPISIANSADD